jgi:hypothetical protein
MQPAMHQRPSMHQLGGGIGSQCRPVIPEAKDNALIAGSVELSSDGIQRTS